LISSVNNEALAWLMAQPRPVKATSRTTPSETPSIIVMRRRRAGWSLVTRRRRVEDSEVWAVVVFQD